MSAAIVYQRELDLSADDYIACVGRTTLGSTRPLGNPARVAAMLENSDLVVTARDAASGGLLGLARCLTDWHWVCYCMDLVVVEGQQGKGIGKAILDKCTEIMGPRVGIALLAMPEAEPFYQRIGMEQYAGFWRERLDKA
jgi:GNAT superfamily N-acetyltransferase